METTFLRLLLIIVITSTVTALSLSDLSNCSLTSGKLSTRVKPIKYTVSLTILPHSANMHGSTDIVIDVKEATRNISLHARNLDVNFDCTVIIKPDQLAECHNKEIIADRLWKVVYCPEDEILLLIFLDYLPPGIYTLHIEHSSRFAKSLEKINYAYSWSGYDVRWLVTNLFDQNSTRELFPCWDDPTIKAPFEIIIRHDKIFTLFSNEPVRYTVDEIDNLQLTYFLIMQPVSTYYLAFMMVRGIVRSRDEQDINYLWHRQNNEELFTYMHTVTRQIFQSFEADMNVIASNKKIKIDHVVLPHCPMKSAGKPGVVIYREKDVIFDDLLHFYSQYIDVAKLVASQQMRQLLFSYNRNSHELLTEMLASFYGYYTVDKIFAGGRLMELFVVQNLQTVLDSDIYLQVEPISHKAMGDAGIDGLLYSLLYHKKAFVLMRMLLHLITPSYFRHAMRKYVQSRTDFWTALQEQYLQRNNDKYTIKEIMDSWLTEKHHPEMHFTFIYNKGIVEYNATCFNKICKCKIPFTYVSRKTLGSYNTANVTWYDDESEKKLVIDFSIKNFFLVNMEQVGYYRVNYDHDNWLSLSSYLQQISFKPIPVLNRAQIINDAFYFTITGKIESNLFFDIIKFLHRETDYIVWYPMFNIFSYMSDYLKTPISDTAKENFLYYLNGLLSRIGYEKLQNEHSMTTALRLLAIKWACEFGHTECKNIMAEKLVTNNITTQTRTLVTLQWTDWMYCTAMMNVNLTVWNMIMQNGIRLADNKYIKLLSCAEYVPIILHYIHLILETNTIKNTGVNIVEQYRFMVKKHVRRDEVLNYVLDYYNTIEKRFGDHDLMGHIIMNLYSDKQLNEINRGNTRLHDFRINHNWELFRMWVENRKIQLRNILEKFKVFNNIMKIY